jgi:glycosyltransferase involved in cell wall biosynthesis
MRIAIDGRAIYWTGIGRYVRNLVQQLVQSDSKNEYLLLVGKEDKERLQRDPQFKTLKVPLHVVSDSYYSWREQTVFLAQLLRIKADLFHFTHFNVPLLFTRPYVVTIHDVTRFLFSGQTKQDIWSQMVYEYVFVRSVERARAIICVSQATKQDLLQLPVRVPALQVLPEAVEEVFFGPVKKKTQRAVRQFLGINNAYLVYVGVWMEHKNVRRLLEAFRSVSASYPEVRLVIAGSGKPGYVDLPSLAKELGLEKRVIFPGFVPQKWLPALYEQALACIFPSSYEGFGFPPLEAAAVGTPVVISRVASLPEMLQEGACYVNPDDVEDLAQALKRVIGSAELRSTLKRAGRKAAECFRWKEVAIGHLDLYKTVLE